MEITYLLLGGNLGDRIEYLRRGVDLLRRDVGNVQTVSSVYESEPWGFDDPQWFLNQVAAVETNLSPIELLSRIQQIEEHLGRRRTHNYYQARTIDIDIILYGNLVINTPELIIPHPLMCERMFVLQPMAEIAPELQHPILSKTMAYLKEDCADAKEVRKLDI